MRRDKLTNRNLDSTVWLVEFFHFCLRFRHPGQFSLDRRRLFCKRNRKVHNALLSYNDSHSVANQPYFKYHCMVFHLLYTQHYTSMCMSPLHSGKRNWRRRNGNQWYIHPGLNKKAHRDLLYKVNVLFSMLFKRLNRIHSQICSSHYGSW